MVQSLHDRKKSSKNSARSFGNATILPELKTESWGMLLTDCAIVALLLFFPFIMGGREAWGHRILISLSLFMGLAWSLHRFQKGGRLLILTLEPLLIAGLMLVWYQTIPQTPAVMSGISGEYQRLFPSWGATQADPPSREPDQAVSVGSETSDVAPGPVWNTLSLTPSETRHGFWILLAYGIIGIVMTQRIRNQADCETLLKLVGISGVMMAVFAVAQMATSNDKFFWFYRHPFTGTREVLKGAFTNRNHFAQFLAISVGPLIWWALKERRQHQLQNAGTVRQGLGPAQGNHSNFDNLVSVRLLLLICAVAGVMMCAVLSLSRGGMAAAALAACVSCVGLLRNESTRRTLSLALPATGILLVLGLMLLGGDTVDVRVNQIASGDVNKLDSGNARRTIWAADIEATRKFPLFGTGVGSHREVYPTYMTDFADFSTFEFSHAESTYINLALETGLAGLGLLVIGLAYVLTRLLWRMVRPADSEQAELVAAVSASLLAGAAHATADFIWYAPAIVVTTVVLVVAGLRLCSGFERERGITIPRPFWLAPAVACGGLLLLVQPGLSARVAGEKYWYQYLLTTLDEQRDVADAAISLAMDSEEAEELSLYESDASDAYDADDPGDATVEMEYRNHGHNGNSPDDASQPDHRDLSIKKHRLGLLVKSLKACPDQPRVQLTMAQLCLTLFDEQQATSETPLNLTQIRDTVRSAEFQSQQEKMAWLQRAFGKAIKLPMLADQLARKSLAQCPIQGTAYMLLAETSFLRPASSTMARTMLDQALLVRGYDPRTRFLIGQELLMTGNQAEALEHWSVVFHANSYYRRAITALYSRMVPPSLLLQQFAPKLPELADVLSVYKASGQEYDLKPVLDLIAAHMDEEHDGMSDELRVNLAMDAFDTAFAMGDYSLCENVLTKILAVDESAYRPRKALGMTYFEQKRFDEAARTLLWCYEQQPTDGRVIQLIRDSRRLALENRTPAMPASWQTQQSAGQPSTPL
ncbi:MAG: O-antigen ligase family protein [Planctomycetaceae bacterium]|nr:O-antigen ligase family protein [Planctomycetaceae bacterium]